MCRVEHDSHAEVVGGVSGKAPNPTDLLEAVGTLRYARAFSASEPPPATRGSDQVQLNPTHLTLARLLEGRLFRIPGYQRAYSWTSHQRGDLFRDIREAHLSGREHFMSTVVALARDAVSIGAEEFRTVELVDGQQRITTFVILLKAIEKNLSAIVSIEAKAKDALTGLLVKADEHSLVLLQTNHDSSHVFTDYIRTGSIEEAHVATVADANVVEAVRECERFVASWAAQGSVVDLLSVIRNRMSMILHEVVDESIVYRVFEVLNSRGLDVKWIDKLKSQLMSSLYEHAEPGARRESIAEMQGIWQDIYRTAGKEDDRTSEALQFAGTFARESAPNRILPDEHAARELVRSGGTTLKDIMSAGRWLDRVNRLVHELAGDVRRRAVTRIGHARFVAVAIMLRDFDASARADLIGRWERATFRLFGIGRLDARSYVGEYVRLGHDIVTNLPTAAQIARRLDALGSDFDVDEIMTRRGYWDDWYWRREETRYVLHRYDEFLCVAAKQRLDETEWNKIWATDPARSIEHVKPQHDEVVYTHNLGNLTMLAPGVNSSLGGRPPAEKADAYLESGFKGTIEIGRALKLNAEWGKAAVQERCSRLERFIRKEWRVKAL